MKKHYGMVAVFFLLLSSLACSVSDVEKVSNVGITVCSYKNDESFVTCESAKADVTKKSETQFNVANQDLSKEITTASVTLRLTVEGQGEAKASLKDAAGQVVSVTASKDHPGELSTDVQLTRATVRSAPDATRTGMDTESVSFLITVEVVGGEKAEGVQVKAVVNGVR